MTRETEREKFEAWWMENPCVKKPPAKAADGEYIYPAAHHAWKAWQARAALEAKQADVQMPEHIGTLEEHKYGLAPYGVRWSYINKRTPKNGEKIYAEEDVRTLLAQHGIKIAD